MGSLFVIFAGLPAGGAYCIVLPLSSCCSLNFRCCLAEVSVIVLNFLWLTSFRACRKRVADATISGASPCVRFRATRTTAARSSFVNIIYADILLSR